MVAVIGGIAFADLIAGGNVAPFAVSGRVGLGAIIFLAGRFLVVFIARARARAHGVVVRADRAEGRD